MIRPSSVLLAFLVMLALPERAAGAVIGTFGWDYDPTFTGSVFSVVNGTTSTFEDIFIDLYAPGASSPFQTLGLADIGSGGAVVTIDDLSLLLVPADLDRAVL